MFQSTRPHGARHEPAGRYVKTCRFQSTRPHGARHKILAFLPLGFGFNPRARMGRDTGHGALRSSTPRFNPRARMGRDVVTTPMPFCNPSFQSTRPHGARHALPSQFLTQVVKFQSTRPHGARPNSLFCSGVRPLFQSTRPHGARLCIIAICDGRALFQSTRPHGARLTSTNPHNKSIQPFQSTRPHGARRKSCRE